MFHLNFLAIAVSVVVVFVLSSAWYVGFGKLWAQELGRQPSSDRPQPGKVALELVRSLVVTLVIGGLASLLGVAGPLAALALGLALFAAFPLVLLTGSVIWDGVSWKLAAIHLGDWFVKLMVISLIVGLWR